MNSNFLKLYYYKNNFCFLLKESKHNLKNSEFYVDYFYIDYDTALILKNIFKLKTKNNFAKTYYLNLNNCYKNFSVFKDLKNTLDNTVLFKNSNIYKEFLKAFKKLNEIDIRIFEKKNKENYCDWSKL